MFTPQESLGFIVRFGSLISNGRSDVGEVESHDGQSSVTLTALEAL